MLVVFSAGLFGAACGHSKSIPIMKDKIQAAHRVAVVGFSMSNQISGSANQDRSSSGITGIVNSVKDTKQALSGDDARRDEQEAKEGLQVLVTEMEKRFGWEILPPEALARSESYSQRYQAKASNGMLDRGMRVPGVISYASAVEWLNKGAGPTLARELGADAVIAFSIDLVPGAKDTKFAVSSGDKTVAGAFVKRPKAQISARTYDSAGTVIWSRQYVSGEPASKGIATNMGVENRSQELEAFVEATRAGWLALLKNYDAESGPVAAK
ncbi:MAG TPA: hypothetical protein VNO55_11925 [Polyangia bacterium]|nr:hypothetical protein [Polyangia bacterium]